jgi:hypothetical protein
MEDQKQFEASVVLGSLVGAALLVLIALAGPYILAMIFACIFKLCDIYNFCY